MHNFFGFLFLQQLHIFQTNAAASHLCQAASPLAVGSAPTLCDISRTREVSLGTASSQGPLICALNLCAESMHAGHAKTSAACSAAYAAAHCQE